MNKFAIEFFKIYDRKIASGEIRFSELGISKDDFTSLCTNPDFKLSNTKVDELCTRMRLSKEEAKNLKDAY